MKKLLMYLALATGLFAADAANDVILSQRKADNSGNIQRNVAPTANGFLTFDASKIPGSSADVTYTSANGFNANSTATVALRGITSSQYSATTDSAKFNGRKARGTAASPLAITTGDFLTRWSGWGYDGTNFIESASIGFGSTGTIAATRVPSFITFMTGTNAAPTVMTEAFRVEADQSIRVPNTNTAGIQLYNTVDQTTNYERVDFKWGTNVAIIGTTAAGTGIQRQLRIGADTANQLITPSYSTAGAYLFTHPSVNSGLASARGWIFTGFNSSAISGTNVGLSITPTYNQSSGTAANTDLLINRTQTAVGSGTQRLLDAQVGSSSKFSVLNTGRVDTYNGLATAGNGLVSVQGVGRVTAQTGANASVATYTVGASDASFVVSANVLVTTSTTHNFTVTCAYTDEGNTARTVTLNFSNVGGTIATAIANAGGAVPYEGIPLHIRAKAATAITVATTGTFTTVTYNAEAAITKLQ